MIFGYSNQGRAEREECLTEHCPMVGLLGSVQLHLGPAGDTGVSQSLLHCSGQFLKADFSPHNSAGRDSQAPKG